MRWRALLIAAIAYAFAVLVYALVRALISRRNPASGFVSVRADVVLHTLLGGGGAAIGILLFLSHDWVPGSSGQLRSTELFSPAHCRALGRRRCALHFTGGVGVLVTAALLLATATFEVIYTASRHSGSAPWRESLRTLSSDLGAEGLKRSKTKSKRRETAQMSISDPFPSVDGMMRIVKKKESVDGALPLISPHTSPCSTFPPYSTMGSYDRGSLADRPRRTPSRTQDYFGPMVPAGPPRPAPAHPVAAHQQQQQQQATHHTTRSMGSTASTFPSSPSGGSISTLATTPLFGLAPAYVTPPSATPRSTSLSPTSSMSHAHGNVNAKDSLSSSPSVQRKTQTGLVAPTAFRDVDVEGRPKLSMEQIARKRLLLYEGTL